MFYPQNNQREVIMESNVIGQVNNTQLAKNKGLYALFEAISNSIHALEDTGDKNGKIEIRIIRPQRTLPTPEAPDSPIKGFIVFDNGIGFTDGNYTSFNEANSQFKFGRGGKGIGRFTWLKVFRSVYIESAYYSDDQCHLRNFIFSLDHKNGISNHRCERIEGNGSYSSVTLKDIRDDYRRGIPLSHNLIANKIVEHFLEYFVLGKMPGIKVVDESNGKSIDLLALYKALVAVTKTTNITIGNHPFSIIHFILETTVSHDHRWYFTGHQRVVKDLSLKGRVFNLPKYLSVPGKDKCIYAAYISSPYLDSHLNSVRADFDIPDIFEDGSFFNEIDWSTILENIRTLSSEYLAQFTMSVKENKNRRVQNFVEKNAPEYRHILKHYPGLLDEIPPDVTEEQIDGHMHRLNREVEREVRRKITQLLKSDGVSKDQDYYAQRKQVYDQLFAELNDLSKSNLAKYILERKLVLDVFEHALQLSDDQKYATEKEIHKMIFPLRKVSDDVLPDHHNLWLIDEKLAYHYYLASDIPLNKLEKLHSASDDRPDLLVFDHCFATSDDPNRFSTGVYIFEFKRPVRTEYPEGDDPLSQVYRYVEQIKSGQLLDKNGRPFKVAPGIAFYSYIICDITSKVKAAAKASSLSETPDGLGYIGYNSGYGTYIEIVSFQKLLEDAKKRNRVLFEKLNLPTRIDPGSSDT